MLAEEAFQSHGFKTLRNVRMKSPRGEIDLLALQNGTAFAIDCKHWKRTVGFSTMASIGKKQVERCKNYLKTSDQERIIPVILTWKDESLNVLRNGVPIVPIHKISDFVLNWESSPTKIRILRRTKGAHAQMKLKFEKDQKPLRNRGKSF